ncbi:MAG: glycoside hydrolase family 2 [Acidobacteria bacterium]|nr:glycoside hydrolase family 2 [Acidobacteriota bacterium]MBA3785230.1 glycoside hydrolase family 2 [Acidobacteriota bacterium]MBA4182745.1 glycoside hydrolase family 2 [Acidobacteriota bacterium]
MTTNHPDQKIDHRDLPQIVADKINPLPRSILRRTAFEVLDGEWKFAFDVQNHGRKERWYKKHDYTETAMFPGSIESHLSAAKSAVEASLLYHETDEVVAWYEREFSIPENWTDQPNAITQLTFGACGYETRVWLNGSPLKTIEGEKAHFGEYTSFSYELPTELLQPVNRLTVRVVDTIDANIPRGKQASRVYKQGGIWYQTISGAVRSVWIEMVAPNRLRSRLGVISGLRNRLVEFDFTMRIRDAGLYRLRLSIRTRNIAVDSKDKTFPVTAEFNFQLEAGERIQRVPVELPDAELWSPTSPNLYHLLAELIAPDGSVTGIETHFGIRKIGARGRRMYLNNDQIYLDGILYQPGVSTFDEMRRHLYAIKSLGCNLARVHIAGIDPRIYDIADEIGLMLWVEVPSPHSSSQASRNNHRAELQRMLVFIASHPSIVILSLYNEDWGVEDIRTSVETRRYISDTFDYMRLNYPQLLVVDNDGWNHVSRNGRLSSHILTAHVYTPDVAAWTSALDRLIKGETDGVTAQPMIVGDPYFYRGQTPLIISEWGGFGFTNYGGPGANEEKATRIREFKREMHRRQIAGDIYTQATSIEEENNGIIDPESGDLLVPRGLLGSNSSDE